MVGEKHQQAQADKQQHERAADRQPGKSRGAAAPGDADRVQPGRAVGEGRHKNAEHHLIRPVPQKIPQQPRRVLGRRQLQCHHGQAQQQRDHRHHRPGDPDQQRPRVIGGPLKSQRRARADADQRQQRPRGQGGQHRHRRQHPQRPPDILPQRITTDHGQPPARRCCYAAGPVSQTLGPALTTGWHGPGSQIEAAGMTPSRGRSHRGAIDGGRPPRWLRSASEIMSWRGARDNEPFSSWS